MFCRNCGKELNDGVNFCQFCGCEVKKVISEEKPKKKKKTKKTNPIAIGFVVLAVVFLGVLIAWEAKQDITKNKAIEDALLYMEEENYESAIAAFQIGFEYGDNHPEHYLLLAKAYVETGDLYHAQKTLQTGYANTKSKDLRHVELWGPAQPFDILFMVSEVVPNVRQKYIFEGNDIEAQYYAIGRVVFTNKYYYDENGRLTGCQLYDYCSYAFGAGEVLYLCADDLERCVKERETSIFLSYDFVYPEENRVEVWSWNAEVDVEAGEVYATEQELFAILHYEADTCVSMAMKEGNVSLSYDDAGRVASITDMVGQQWEVTYSELGDYSISVNDGELVLQFNSDGLNTDCIMASDDEDYRITTYFGNVAKIFYRDELQYHFTYDEKNRISQMEQVLDGITVKCFYDSYSESEQLFYIEYNRPDAESFTRIFEYDKQGRLSEISQNNEMIWFSYDENGRCTNYTYYDGWSETVYQMIYDDLGRITDIEMQ